MPPEAPSPALPLAAGSFMNRDSRPIRVTRPRITVIFKRLSARSHRLVMQDHLHREAIPADTVPYDPTATGRRSPPLAGDVRADPLRRPDTTVIGVAPRRRDSAATGAGVAPQYGVDGRTVARNWRCRGHAPFARRTATNTGNQPFRGKAGRNPPADASGRGQRSLIQIL